MTTAAHAASLANGRLMGRSQGSTRHIGRNRCARSPDSGGQRFALIIGAVIASLLGSKILTVCRVHLINIGDCIREIMILHTTVTLAGCQETRHHGHQAKYKLTSAGHNEIFQGQIASNTRNGRLISNPTRPVTMLHEVRQVMQNRTTTSCALRLTTFIMIFLII